MNTLIWVLQGVLGFVFLMAGGMKLAQPRAKVIASGGKWAEDFSAPAIKLIGLGEVLCALGIILPKALGMGSADMASMASAIGIMVFMAGAFFTHLKRKEMPFLGVTGAFFAMAAVVTYLAR